MTFRKISWVVGIAACLPLGAHAVGASELGYSPYAGIEHPTRVLWGDTHLHTTNSFDARTFGVTLDAEAAYRFARGEEVVSSSGQRARLGRPLDFLVVTDHSDAMGAVDELIRGNETLLADPVLRDTREKLLQGEPSAIEALTSGSLASFLDGESSSPLLNRELSRTVWDRYVETADRFNEPGRFTALIGYEWTPMKSGDNLHRNVLYRDDAEKARRLLPFTASESVNPQDLWKWMQRYEEETGGEVLALAHNGNLSNGQMFPVETNPSTGDPYRCRLREDAKSLGAALRSDPDQRRRRDPSRPVTERRVRGFRDLGSHEREWGPQDARHDPLRICARGPQERAGPRARAWNESLPLWNGGIHGQPHGALHRSGGELLRKVRDRGAGCDAPHGAHVRRQGIGPRPGSWVLRDTQRSGPQRTRARRSSTR